MTFLPRRMVNPETSRMGSRFKQPPNPGQKAGNEKADDN